MGPYTIFQAEDSLILSSPLLPFGLRTSLKKGLYLTCSVFETLDHAQNNRDIFSTRPGGAVIIDVMAS